MQINEFVAMYPLLVHYSPSQSFCAKQGLMTAAQVLDSCADSAGTVEARFLNEVSYTRYPVAHWKVNSRFKLKAGERNCNLMVRNSEGVELLLGNNYPLGSGECLGTTFRSPITGRAIPSRRASSGSSS